ncbi:kinase-like domain-containing protein [Suillus subalutaceus]|uniref:kinase-like domain-containing protein n=1 Tax=Suillus subalutaceus TaxID=48586 RepID=UPI001B8649F3|nr:kinase-like domain-containing protein [Suillus subalutaceus]KAG1839638.1 kinase-like domain-containing protein [Suillus subalutaceus]
MSQPSEFESFPDFSQLLNEPPPCFRQNLNVTRFQLPGVASSAVMPVVLFPRFNPPLRPPPRQFSYRRWFTWVFRTGDNSIPSPFDVDREQCYSLHAATDMESPRFSYEEIFMLIRSAPSYPSEIMVYKITADTIVKVHVSADEVVTEALNLSMIKTMTTIPVPEVIEVVVNTKNAVHYLVMEYLDGQTLDSCWNSLTLFSKLRIAWILRSYVAQLRRLRRTVPGTLDGTSCTGPLFTDYGAGPFVSYDHLTAWFNHKLDVSQRMKKAPLDAPRFDNFSPVVFTHQDLCPRNILLGRDGKLYVLDWHKSGFYPAWFEYAGMVPDYHLKSPLWDLLVPWISHTVSIRTRKRIAEYKRNIGWALTIGALM